MTPAQNTNLVAEARRIIERHEAGEYMHPATLAMARAEVPGCGSCLDWQLRASPAHAKVGLAACANGESFVFMDSSKGCSNHRPASVEIVAGRTAYFGKQGVKT